MQVIAFDPFPRIDFADSLGFTYTSLNELLGAADIISLHAPSNKNTFHMIGDEQLRLVKPHAILINTARGDLVDTVALAEALQAQRLYGAALDVVEQEQTMHRPSSPLAAQYKVLLNHPNVIVTNHNAFNTKEAIDKINSTTCNNILAFLNNAPENIIS